MRKEYVQDDRKCDRGGGDCHGDGDAGQAAGGAGEDRPLSCKSGVLRCLLRLPSDRSHALEVEMDQIRGPKIRK